MGILEMIFAVLMLMVFGKILLFALKAAWGLTKIVFSIVLLPLALIGIFLAGFSYIALIVLVVIGIGSFILH